MNVVFFQVDGILNFDGSDAKAPDGSMGISEARVKQFRKLLDGMNAKPVLYGSWKKEWEFRDELCTAKGTYLNKKLNRRGIHILDKTKDGESDNAEINEWLSRHPNIEDYYTVWEGDLGDE